MSEGIGHQMGFWRHPGHVRKCDLARSYNHERAIQKGVARLRRQEIAHLVGYAAAALVTGTLIVLFLVAIVHLVAAR